MIFHTAFYWFGQWKRLSRRSPSLSRRDWLEAYRFLTVPQIPTRLVAAGMPEASTAMPGLLCVWGLRAYPRGMNEGREKIARICPLSLFCSYAVTVSVVIYTIQHTTFTSILYDRYI